VADPKILKNGGQKTIYQLRPHLSLNEIMPFTQKKLFEKNEPMGPPPPPPWIRRCLLYVFQMIKSTSEWSVLTGRSCCIADQGWAGDLRISVLRASSEICRNISLRRRSCNVADIPTSGSGDRKRLPTLQRTHRKVWNRNKMTTICLFLRFWIRHTSYD